MNYKKESLQIHQKLKGKISLISKIKIKNKKDLSLVYTPGVAEVSLAIAKNPADVYKYTSKNNLVAIVTDGSAVLGLGNIGPQAALPVMEGKAVLFKEFGGVDAVPICLATQEVAEIIKVVELISPTFGGINLEDISAPRCFEIEEELIKRLDIPVFHDDQHGTAIVVLAGLINSLRVTKKDKAKVKIVINGAGAAGIAITKLLYQAGFKDLIVLDSKGTIYKKRTGLNEYKKEVAKFTNKFSIKGNLAEAIKGADIFIGVSQPNLLKESMVKSMRKNPIVFAMANPSPEIMPEAALGGGAAIVATGRSDFPNQINNALVFPGLFRGLLDNRIKKVTPELKIEVAKAITDIIKKPTAQKIIPDIFDKKLTKVISSVIKKFKS